MLQWRKCQKKIPKEVFMGCNMFIRCRKCYWFMENIIPEAELLGNWFCTYGVRFLGSLKWICLTDNIHELHATYLHCQQVGVWCLLLWNRLCINLFNQAFSNELMLLFFLLMWQLYHQINSLKHQGDVPPRYDVYFSTPVYCTAWQIPKYQVAMAPRIS